MRKRDRWGEEQRRTAPAEISVRPLERGRCGGPGGVRGHLFLLQSVLTNGSVRAVREALGPTREKSETRPQDFEFPVQPAGRQCGEGQAVPTGEPWRS